MKIQWLQKYDAIYGGNKLSAFYGYHEFRFGGVVTRSIHLWPLYIELGPAQKGY